MAPMGESRGSVQLYTNQQCSGRSDIALDFIYTVVEGKKEKKPLNSEGYSFLH